jgi:hypothetical protein
MVLPLRDEDFGLAEVADDLLRDIALPGHDDPFRTTQILTLGLGTIQGVRSRMSHKARSRQRRRGRLELRCRTSI